MKQKKKENVNGVVQTVLLKIIINTFIAGTKGGIYMNKIASVIIIFITASIVLFAGCIGKEPSSIIETPISTVTPLPTSMPEQVMPTPTPTLPPTVMFIRMADLTTLEILPELKKQVYDRNIVIINVSAAKQDKPLFDQAIKDMQQSANDVGGDIAMITEDLLVVTPRNVSIDRAKLR